MWQEGGSKIPDNLEKDVKLRYKKQLFTEHEASGELERAWPSDFAITFCASYKIKGFWRVSYEKAVRED